MSAIIKLRGFKSEKKEVYSIPITTVPYTLLILSDIFYVEDTKETQDFIINKRYLEENSSLDIEERLQSERLNEIFPGDAITYFVKGYLFNIYLKNGDKHLFYVFSKTFQEDIEKEIEDFYKNYSSYVKSI